MKKHDQKLITGKTMDKCLSEIDYHNGFDNTFDDFLTLCLGVFMINPSNDFKEKFERLQKKYKPRDFELFDKAFFSLADDMTGPDQQGLVDVLGEYYEKRITWNEHGQFFTPPHVCDMMALITMFDESRSPFDLRFRRVLDPACGSGRNLLSAAKINRNCMFYGADIDYRCANITAINCVMNSLAGEIVCMDTLANSFRFGYHVCFQISGEHKIPRLREIPKEESHVWMNGWDTI